MRIFIFIVFLFSISLWPPTARHSTLILYMVATTRLTELWPDAQCTMQTTTALLN